MTVPPKNYPADIRISDAIHGIPTEFRSVAPPSKEAQIHLLGLDTKTVYTGPNLFAAVETARLAHQQKTGLHHPPIYTHVNGACHWWDGSTSRGPTDLDVKTRAYLATIYGCPTRNVHIKWVRPQ